MIISDDSPLWRLPGELGRKQALFLDGIRYSVEIADLAHTRLRQTLFEPAQGRDHPESPPDHWLFVSAVQDAWSVVDSLHRLRGLLKQMPGSKKKGPGLQIFMRSTDSIEELRNVIQHLNHEIDKLVNQNQPVWGSLSWFAALDPCNNLGALCYLIPGTMFVDARGAGIEVPSGEVDLPVDRITLSASEYSVSLSDAMKRVASLVEIMEDELKEQFSGHSVAGGDLLAAVHVQFGNAAPDESTNNAQQA